MKFFFILFILLPAALWAGMTTQARVGDYSPKSNTLSKIFHKGGLEFETETSLQVTENFSLWLNLNGFQKKGSSLGLENNMNLAIFPLSSGIKYHLTFAKCISFYVGGGVSYSFLYLHDNTPFIKQHTHQKVWGKVGKSGVLLFLTDKLFIDLFADYYLTKTSAFSKDLPPQNIGGLRTGIGLGTSY